MANTFIDVRKTSKEHKVALIFVILGLLTLIYLSARGNYYLEKYPEKTVFVAFFASLGSIIENPFAISFSGNFFKNFAIEGLIATFFVWVVVDTRISNRHYTDGEQCGTAKWQTPASIKKFNQRFNEPFGKPFADGNENMIFSKNCQLSTNTRHTGLNNNVMCIGGPGSGKSFNIVRPNLLQAPKSCSNVVLDPSGELLQTTGKFFEDNGFGVRVFNLTDMAHSHRYNPFRYLRSEEDVLTLIECFIKNTENPGKTGGDQFWEKAETALYEAIIFYLMRHHKKDKEKQNFSMVSKLLRHAKTDPKMAKSKLDTIFDSVRRIDENDICVKQYDIFKQAPDRTAQSILISAAVRLAPFNIEAVESLTIEDDLDLMSIGDKPTIVYIIVPQGNNPYAFLVNMLYCQMFDTLYYHAANDCEGLRLKQDVRFYLDEFANCGVIPNYSSRLTTMRKYGISCMHFIQAVGQIKNLYKDDWETLMGACDTLIYLGGNELSSMEDLSKKLGDQTIRVRDHSRSHSAKGGSNSTSFKYTKRPLMSVDEIRRLKDGYCVVLIKGEQPFYDEKYKTFDHPNAVHLGNLDKGVRIYRFTYCNTRPRPVHELEAARENIQENTLKKSAQARRPSEKAYKTNSVMPSGNLTEEEAENIRIELANRTLVMNINKQEAIKTGAVVTEVRGGIASVASAKPRGEAVCVSDRAAKQQIAPSTSNTEDLLDQFNSIF